VQGTGLVGQSIAVLDADMDGNADLLIGASMAHQTGEAYLVYGPDTGTVETSSAVTLRPTSHAYFGTAVSGGDADMDGIDDVLVAGPAWMSHSAYLFHGPITSDRDAADADARFVGWHTDNRSEGLAVDVDLSSDLDGDTIDDVVLGAPVAWGTGGKVYVASAAASGAVLLARDAKYTFVAPPGEHLGGGTVPLGDLNGDGIGDLAMGQFGGFSGEGTVYMVEGGLAIGRYDVDAVANATITGPTLSNLGFRVAAADYDDDGTTDIFAGAPSVDSGAAFGFLGTLSGAVSSLDADVVWVAELPVEMLGAGLATGDADGDDRADVLLCARNGAWLRLGPASGVVDVAGLDSFPAEAPTAHVGGDMAAFVPDWDGDGADEIALGAPRAEESIHGFLTGHVYVFFSGSLF
jgi:hypothetical protein